jgi:Ca-activated chloride channel family protein
LEVGIIPQGGTALAEAIQTAETAFKEEGENHRVLVLFTDGEDHDSGAVAAAEKAAQNGLRIFTVGVGTPGGELLRQRDEKGNVSYVKDSDGNVVKSRLNEGLLTQIATSANGFYLPLSGASTMDVLYQRGLAPLPKNEVASKLVKEYHERFQWPLALAILFLVTELFLTDRKMVRRSQAAVMATNPELRKLVTAALVGLLTLKTVASPASALREYQSGHFKDAHQEYLRLLQRKPDDSRLQYNAGDAAYQAKNFEEAVKHFSAAAAAPDLKLQEQAYYNLGDSLYRMGEEETDAQKKSETWEQSAKQFESALKLNAKDPDAQFNLDLVRKRLEELKKQQEQSKQQSKDQKNDQNKPEQKPDDKQSQSDKSKDSKDKPNPDQPEKKDQSKQDQSEKPNDEKKEQPKQEQDQEQQPQPKPKPQPSKDKAGDQTAKPASPQSDQDAKQGGDTNAMSSAEAAPGQMTPEQAKQLLDSQKSEQKAMIFIPPDKQKARKRAFKDW